MIHGYLSQTAAPFLLNGAGSLYDYVHSPLSLSPAFFLSVAPEGQACAGDNLNSHRELDSLNRTRAEILE